MTDITHVIATARSRGNVSRLGMTDDAGRAFELALNGITRVSVVVCTELHCAEQLDVPFEGSVVFAQFGLLDLPAGKYYPKIVGHSDDNPEGEVLAGEGFRTEILLTVVC